MAEWESIDRALEALGIRIGPPTLGQTTGGSHVAGSEHFEERARDFGVGDSDAAAIATALVPYAQGPDAPVDELFFSPLNIFYDSGVAYTPTADERQGHYSHVHVGVRKGVDLAALVAGGPRAAPMGTPATMTGSGGGGAWAGVGVLARRVAFTAAFVAAGVALLALGGMRAVGGARPA